MIKLTIKILAILNLIILVAVVIYIACRPCGAPVKILFIGILIAVHAIAIPMYSNALRRSS